MVYRQWMGRELGVYMRIRQSRTPASWIPAAAAAAMMMGRTSYMTRIAAAAACHESTASKQDTSRVCFKQPAKTL